MRKFRIIPNRLPEGPKLTRERLVELFFGEGFFSDKSLFRSRDEMKRCWTEHREGIMRFWFTEKHFGTRPWVWWEFDAPGQRRVLGMIPFTDARGNPEVRLRYPDKKPIKGWEVREEEDIFLEREGLLLPFEIEYVLQWRKDRELSERDRLSKMILSSL
jgi:hypothetical protein